MGQQSTESMIVALMATPNGRTAAPGFARTLQEIRELPVTYIIPNEES